DPGRLLDRRGGRDRDLAERVDLRPVRRDLGVDERHGGDVGEDVDDDGAADRGAAGRGRAGEREVLEADRVPRLHLDAAVRDHVDALRDRGLGVEEDDLDRDRGRDAGAAVVLRRAAAAGETPGDQVVLLVARVDRLDRDALTGDHRVLPDGGVVRDVGEVDADGGGHVRAVDAGGDAGRLRGRLRGVLGAQLHLAARAGHVRAGADLRLVGRHDPVEADRGGDADAAAVGVAALGARLAVAGARAAVRAVAVLGRRQRARVRVPGGVRVVVDLTLLALVGVLGLVLVRALRRRVCVRLRARRRLGADLDGGALHVAGDLGERVPVEDDVERDADADGGAAGGDGLRLGGELALVLRLDGDLAGRGQPRRRRAEPRERVLAVGDDERDARRDRGVVAGGAHVDLGLGLTARERLDVDVLAAAQHGRVLDLGARLRRGEDVQRHRRADADALRVLGLGVGLRQVELVRLRLDGDVVAARGHLPAGLHERLGLVVRDDVDRDGARDPDVGLARAGVGLRPDLVLGEAEELVGRGAARKLGAVPDRRLCDPVRAVVLGHARGP